MSEHAMHGCDCSCGLTPSDGVIGNIVLASKKHRLTEALRQASCMYRLPRLHVFCHLQSFLWRAGTLQTLHVNTSDLLMQERHRRLGDQHHRL